MLLPHGVQRWLKGIPNDFLGGLNQKGDGSSDSKARGIAPYHSPIDGYNALRMDGGPQVSGSIPKGNSPPFHIQKGIREAVNGDTQGQVGLMKLSFKALQSSIAWFIP